MNAQPPSTNERITAFQKQISEMRRDLQDTFSLIDKLRENCLNIEAKLATAERDYAALLSTTEASRRAVE